MIIPRSLRLLAAGALCGTACAQRQMEELGRGLVAMRTSSTQIYLGWRLLGNDPEGIAFNLYRSANGAEVKVNPTPLTASTNLTDSPPNLGTTAYTYSVRPVVGGVEVADSFAHPLGGPAVLPVNPATRQYTPVPIQATPDGILKVGFCWVGDLNGDGDYDYVIVRQNQLVADSREFLEAYESDGTFLWRMNMGPNSTNHYHIEPGSSTLGNGHGDNATVYDLDGDGKAEVIVRTANGVVFHNGATVTAANNNSQFISIVNGQTGVEMARDPVPNPYLSDGPMNGHMGIAYFDGRRPSVFLAAKNRRADDGFQGLTSAWDYRGGVITRRWSYDADTLGQHAPEGHQIRLGDPDNDGKDEFLDIGYGIDDNGLQLFNIPEVVHGDRFHTGDIDPDRPGLETYLIQQNNGTGLATALIEAATGKFIKKWYAGGVVDVGRGLAADIDPAHKGMEMFSTQGGIFNSKGVQIHNERPFPPEAVWWDGNLSREMLATVGSTAESPAIARFDPNFPANQSRIYTIYNQTPPGVYWAYGGRPHFWGDIQGDWREEVVVVANDHSELRVYTTTSVAPNRIYTLMHNPQYRIQATTKGYVQASYVDYHLGDGMTATAPPPMVEADLVWRGGPGATTWDNGISSSWTGAGANASFAAGKTVRFDIGADNSTTVALAGTLQPGAVAVYSPKHQIIDGTNGSLAGAMKLLKSGAGSLTLSGSHSFTGATAVWDGALILNGTLQGSPVTVWGGTFGGTLAEGLTGGRVGGTGTFSQAVTLGYRGAITPGSGMGNAGTLTFGNGLVAQDGSYLALDLSNNPASPSANDRIAITGNFSLAGKVGIVIKALDGTLPPGTYTLATYTGTLTGSVSNFAVTVPPGTPYTLAAGSGAVTLTIPVTRAPAAVVWRGNGAAWDLATSQNWLAGGSPAIFVAGDTVTFDGSGAANAIATLTGALPVASVTVNAGSDYTFSGTGSIHGTGGLTKSGSGTLTINTANDYSGPTTVTGGVLAIASLGDAGTPSSIGTAGTSAGNLVINGGTLRLTGSQSNTNRGMTLGTSGGTLDVANASSSMQISGTVTGGGRLTKAGPGTLILAKNNTYTGSTTISGGTIYLAGATANTSGLGTGSITFDNGTLTMANVQASETAAWNMIVPAGATGRLNADGRCSLIGSLTGAGTFDYYSPYVRSDLKGNWSAFTGQIRLATDADGSEMRVANTFGFGTAALHIGAESYVYFNVSNSGPTLNIGELTGDATTGIGGGPSAGSTVTWRVGGRNTDATFAGGIFNGTGPTAIVKNGSGIWTLAGASTHTGATTVSAGTLRIDGTSAGSAVTVQNAAALGGSGRITGNVSIQSGGILEHGSLGATPLTISGNLTFGTAAVVRPLPGIALSPGSYTVLTYSGTLAGTPVLSWQAPVGSTLDASFDLATPGVVTMTLAQQPGTTALVWTGAVSSAWDTATANWTTGGGNAAFANGSLVSFTDAGNASAPVGLSLDVEPKSVTVDAAQSYTLNGAGRIAGEGALSKSGTGTLTLANAHLYTGGTTISGGTVVIGNATALGTGPVTLAGGTWATGTLTPPNPVVVTANSTITGGSAGGTHGIGAVSGSHVLTLTTTGAFDLEGDLSGFSGTLFFNGSGGGRFFNTAFSGSAAATFDLGTRNLSARQGAAFNLGALAGQTGSSLGMASNSGSAGCVFTIGGNNADSTFAGAIYNGSATKLVGIVKTGGGTLTLAGTNTYSAATTVNTGKLSVTGSLATTTTTVANTGTLGGSGSIAGPVTCHGTLAPGIAAGTLTLSSGLTLSPTSVLDFELGTVSDRVNVTGNLTLAGTLNVTGGPGFGPGTYTLVAYTGSLSDEDGVALGSLPADFEATVSTSTPGEIRLVVTSTLTAFEQWQIEHFGSTGHPDAAATADPDGDGTTNAIEFLLGLDPKNGGSAFRASGEEVPGGFRVTWPSAAGVAFEVRRSTGLGGSWLLLATVTGTGAADFFIDTAPPPGRAFYKIVILE